MSPRSVVTFRELGRMRGPRLLLGWPMWIWLAPLYITAAVVHLSLGLRVVSPWILVDELVYSDIARSVADSGRFLIRGSHADYGDVYPLLLSSVYRIFGPMRDVYAWARVVNALTMCSVVAPAYLLARRVVRPAAALAVAALSVAVPDLVYVGTLMTENAFYPIFIWLAFALVAALQRPTFRRQLAVLALCLLAFLTRAQAVALIAAVLTAPLMLAWIERSRPRRLIAWAPTYLATSLAAILVVAVELARGRSPTQILGGYSVTANSGTYHPWPALKWVVFHLAALDISLWVLPFAALVLLIATARQLGAAVRAFTAAAAMLCFWLVLEVGVFASAWSLRIEERNLFYLAPLLLTALFAWIEHGQPRPPRATRAAALLAAALPAAIPFARVLTMNSVSDTPFLQPWWYLGDTWIGTGDVVLIAVAISGLLAALFLWLPSRYAPLLPTLVALGLLATWLPLQLWTRSFARLSTEAASQTIILSDAGWIDQAVGAHTNVIAVWSGSDALGIWENEFWNRSIHRVYDFDSAPLPGALPEARLRVRDSSGVLQDPTGSPVRTGYVLTHRSLQPFGTLVAADGLGNFKLYRVTAPLRAVERIKGRYDDNWTGHNLDWTHYSCRKGVLVIDVRSDSKLFAGKSQQISITGTTTQAVVTLPSTEGKTLHLPLTPENGICRVHFAITPTRRPSSNPALHNHDPRRLGILIASLRYEPTR